MSTVFVERRAGAIVGVYAQLQPGIAEEELPADHADVLAYRAPKAQTKTDRIAARVARDPEFAALVGVVAKAGGKSRADLLAELAQKMQL